jgi:hypothetical protein
MRIGRFLLGGALVLSSALVVHADGISPSDPKILIGRGSGSKPIKTLSFSVAADFKGGGFFPFDNATGQDWVGLILTVTFKNAVDAKAALTCESDIFNSNDCASSRHGITDTFTFSGGKGIPKNSEFFLDLNDDGTLNGNHGRESDVGGFKMVTLTATTAPEPATLPLLLAGLVGIWLWRTRKIHREVNTHSV